MLRAMPAMAAGVATVAYGLPQGFQPTVAKVVMGDMGVLEEPFLAAAVLWPSMIVYSMETIQATGEMAVMEVMQVKLSPSHPQTRATVELVVPVTMVLGLVMVAPSTWETGR
jgi:hypothetical protein